MVLAVVSIASCDIYDDISEMPSSTASDHSFSYIDATSYIQWVYLDLKSGAATTLPYDDDEHIPDEWTFALHRYDCKTNAGRCAETPFSSLESLSSAVVNGSYRLPEESEMTADVADSIIIDVSHMLDLYLGYASAMVNKEMTRWLDVNISTMPPIYTPSNKVYLLRTKEEEYVAVLFTSFTNPFYYDTKGYISFDYIWL